MNQLHLFLPCAAGVEDFLADEVHTITGASGRDLLVGRGGVMVRGAWRDVLQLNLHSRLAQRVLIELALQDYRSENDLYRAANESGVWGVFYQRITRMGITPAVAETDELCRPPGGWRKPTAVTERGGVNVQR